MKRPMKLLENMWNVMFHVFKIYLRARAIKIVNFLSIVCMKFYRVNIYKHLEIDEIN